ncbi:hypothetical protein HDU91_007461, partial [Kappamyces sp. JEL0680]
DGQVYCGLHYSVLYATRCGGCKCAILKNFVETTKGLAAGRLSVDETVTHWHPCCYMISKLWNIRLASGTEKAAVDTENPDSEVQKQQDVVEKVENILHVLSSFEESAAASISEMLVHFTNEGFRNGAIHARRLVAHVELLFNALGMVDEKLKAVGDPQDLGRTKEPKQLVKKIELFFSILSEKQEPEERQAATKDMIQLVTSLAHVLKIIIRHALAGALRLDQNHGDKNSLEFLLSSLASCSNIDESQLLMSNLYLASMDKDICPVCRLEVDEECIQSLGMSHWKWHDRCLRCTTCQALLNEDTLLYKAETGMCFCKTHGPVGVVNGAKTIPQLVQCISMLRVSLGQLFISLNVGDGDLTAQQKKHNRNPSAPTDKEGAAPAMPKKEEFFDDAEETATEPPKSKRLSSLTKWNVTQQGDDKHPFITDVSGLQLLATRQLAALALHRHVDKWFTLGQLLKIAEGPKRSIWSKMFSKAAPKKAESYGIESTLGFGLVALRIPIIVQESILNLKRSDLSAEGIFRKNGNIRRLKEQCEKIDHDPHHISFQDDSTVQIAALLKKFLRDLPEPLLTESLYDLFLCVPSKMRLLTPEIQKPEDQVSVLQLIMCLMPKQNIDLLSVLVRFFVEVSTYAVLPNDTGNKMTLDNMATVIAPNILYTNRSNAPEQSAAVIEIIKVMFRAHSIVFKVRPVL